MLSPRIWSSEDNIWDSARSTKPQLYWTLPGFTGVQGAALAWSSVAERTCQWAGLGGSPESSFTPSLLPCIHVQSKEEVALFRKLTQPFGLEKMGRSLI